MILPSVALQNGFGLVAALTYLVAALSARHWTDVALTRVVFASWILHGATLLSAWLSDDPRFGFAPALSVTAWIAVLV